jgi:GNAT superfamily N-acetyltransferase
MRIRAMRVEVPPDRPRVELPLSAGGTVVLLPLAPDDRPYLEEGLAELSLESRYARFGQGLAGLSEHEMAYLSNVDQRKHVAWGAVLGEEGVGVGRYIVTADGSADVAITVLDQHQGWGIGTALFKALAAVAQADGVPHFQFYVSPDNSRVVEWLVTAGVDVTPAEGLVEGVVPLDSFEIDEADRIVAAMREYRGD